MILKVLFAIVLVVGLYGFLLPALVSAASTEACLLAATIILVVIYVGVSAVKSLPPERK
jgi:hypothetical protein